MSNTAEAPTPAPTAIDKVAEELEVDADTVAELVAVIEVGCVEIAEQPDEKS